MDVEHRVIAQGIDSWEAEMTYHGTTFKVEAQRETRDERPVWSMEVLKQTSRWTLQPIHWNDYPTLDAAIQGANRVIRDSIEGDSARP